MRIKYFILDNFMLKLSLKYLREVSKQIDIPIEALQRSL